MINKTCNAAFQRLDQYNYCSVSIGGLNDDENGVSLVLVNTEKGKDYFDLIKDRLEIIESDYEKASAMNSNLVVASERPACRDTIYDGFDGLDFDSYVKTKLAFKVNPKTKIKKMIPLGVKRVLKKLH